MSLCDIHQHVVFGVDDGSPDMETSKQMLRRAYEQGITDIICTSHCCPGYRLFPRRQYCRALSELQTLSASAFPGMRLYPGSEIMYNEEALPMLKAGRIPSLAETRNVLLEFMPDMPADLLMRAASDFLSAGFQPVFAHIERYACLREADNFERLREKPVLLQVNAGTVIECGKLFCDRWVKKKIIAGNIDIVASDAHNNIARLQRMGEAYEVLIRLCGQETADDLCARVPRSLLEK